MDIPEHRKQSLRPRICAWCLRRHLRENPIKAVWVLFTHSHEPCDFWMHNHCIEECKTAPTVKEVQLA